MSLFGEQSKTGVRKERPYAAAASHVGAFLVDAHPLRPRNATAQRLTSPSIASSDAYPASSLLAAAQRSFVARPVFSARKTR